MKTWVVVFLLFSCNRLSFSQTDDSAQYGWKLFDSPTRSKISQVIALNNGKLIASANKLYLFKSGKWQKFPLQPPGSAISRIYALNDNNVWASYFKLNNESDFYHYTNEQWTEKSYPLVNGIQYVNLNEHNEGWYCGDREIVYYEKGIAVNIPYPPTAIAVRQSYGTDFRNLWVTAFDKGIFHFNGKKWSKFFSGQEVKYFCFTTRDSGYALVEDALYTFSKGNWEMHSSNYLLEKVIKLCSSGKNEFWGIGPQGLLVHFKDEWKIINIPLKADLFDITFSKDGTGWIAGDRGVILKYTDKATPENYTFQPGFDRKKILNIAKENNDEYGVVIEDFNGDGLKDIYASCLFDLNHLYINKPERNQTLFTEEAMTRNSAGRTGYLNSESMTELIIGAGSADVDNDGDQDLYLCDLLNKNKFLLNDGNGFFRDVSGQSSRAVDSVERTNSAVFSDVDNDGDLDLFLANEYSTNRLYLNNGYGYFTEVTETAGIQTNYGGMGGVFADLNDDNLTDLYVVNWSKENILYKNVTSEGNVRFEKVESITGGGEFKKSNAAVFADYDNDGDMDLFVTNRKFSNRLYRNDSGFKFTDVTSDVIGLDSALSYGATFADFDNDGYLDLFVANVGENILYKNVNGKKFIDVTEEYGVDLGGYSTGTASGDIDGDGDIDLYVSNYLDDNSMLFLNNINNKDFINVNVTGYKSNRDAVGVKIWLYSGGKADQKEYLMGYREISGGSGYSSKDSREAHFGIKEGEYDLVVYFPASGIRKMYGSIINGSVINIDELEGFEAGIHNVVSFSGRFFNDHENQKEFIKLFIVLVIFSSSFYYGYRKYGWSFRHFASSAVPVLAVYLVQIFFLRYEGIFYASIVPIGSVILILLTLHFVYEHQRMREQVREEKQKTRDVLARDLHDDLASTISSALVYTNMVEGDLTSENSKKLISKIRYLLNDAARVVTDIIWTVSSRHEDLEELVQRLQGLMEDLCKANSIDFICESNLTSSLRIPDDTRRNIYLIYKEAINNIIKHSSATKVKFDVYIEEDLLKLSLYDNGIGFDKIPDVDMKESRGYGLRNIQARAGEINADLQIKSGVLQGTYITVKQKLAKEIAGKVK
jgi:enediyne biosynthesis protein E4